MLTVGILIVDNMRSTYQPQIGSRFGRWEVISLEVKNGSKVGGCEARNAYWRVRCICGLESWRSAAALVNGKTNACKACCRDKDGHNSRIVAFTNKFKCGARARDICWDIDASFVESLYASQNGLCAISGVSISFIDKWRDKRGCTCSLDRIDSDLGYLKGNVHLVHKEVNMMKGSLKLADFIEWCSIIGGSKCG